MHILYIYSEITIKGGADKVIVEKANYLATHGYQVTIITESQMGRPTSFELVPQVKHIDMGLDFNKQYSLGILRRFCTYVGLMRTYKIKLANALIELHPDIVITTMGRSLGLLTHINDGSIKIGEAHTTKQHLRSLHLVEQKGGLFKLLAKYMRWKMCRSVSNLSALVLLTQNDADDWGNLTKKYVIPNPISFYPKEAAKLENKQVIMVGRYNNAKGYDYLIPAWEIVHQFHPDWILNVYGSGELYGDVVRWIAERHLEHSIILHVPVDDIMDKYLESSICVLSSRYEGFSLVIIEAMSCGVPCVSFDSPCGPRTIIRHGEDGFLVEYKNISALAENICMLIKDVELRKLMGKNARLSVKRFELDVVMKKWIDLFEGMVHTTNR